MIGGTGLRLASVRRKGSPSQAAQDFSGVSMSLSAYDSLESNHRHEEMNPLERCLATIRWQPHDRVPVDLHNFMMTLAGINLPPEKMFRDGQLLGEAQIAAWQRFGHDMLIVENGTAALAEACGCEVSYATGGARRDQKAAPS
jgi:hypothetical protein